MTVRILLFGETRLVVGGATVTVSQLGRKPRNLLQILAINAGHVVSKERLAELLWEDRPPPAYIAGLESYVSVLRHRLPLGAGRSSVLATAANGYAIDIDRCEIDLGELRRLGGEGTGATSARTVRLCERAAALSVGGLLPDAAYAGWALDARAESDALLADLLTRGAQSATAIGRPERAVALALAAIEHGAHREDAWQHLMRAQWFTGRHSDVLRSYARLRSRLVEELGQEPAAETTAIYLTVLSESTGALDDDHRSELRLLLHLLRQSLDGLPGHRTPPLDSELSMAASRLLMSGPRCPA